MSHIAYINGRYIDHSAAHTHIEDRGYQFADGVYEYIAFYNQILIDAEPHLKRLERSCMALNISAPTLTQSLPIIMRELIEKNHRRDGAIYIQVSRTTAKRDHAFPQHGRANVVVVVRGSKMPMLQDAVKGVKVVTHPDNRWGRCDIKTVSLLANVLAKQYAIDKGAKEAWLHLPDGTITEGAVSNAFLIKDKIIYTHPKTNAILPGITRDKVIELANKLNIKLLEKAFNITDIKHADEAFLTSTSANVQPIVQVDDMVIGNGKAGALTQQLMQAYAKHILEKTGKTW